MDKTHVQPAPSVPPFNRYCSATIPAAFDDSLSFYEAVCSLYNFIQRYIIVTLNETIAKVNELSDFIYNLNLHDYVDQILKEYIDDGTFYETLAYNSSDESLTLTFDIARN